MAVRPWLKSFQQTLAGKKSSRKRASQNHAAHLRNRSDLSRQVETVEDRTLLASQVLFLGGHLQVFTDAGESVTVRENPTVSGLLDVQINGAPGPGTPVLPTSSITAISIINSDGDNNVDLSGVATTNFPALTSVLIDTGNGDDTITGTADLADTILAGDGNDVVTGGTAGNNIDGGDGNDTIMAAEGDDTIDAGDGDDSVMGSEGADSILGDDGNDIIFGGDGNDTVRAGDGFDTVNGEFGADSLFGDLGNDTISGGDENDSLFGGGQADSISGGAGDDFILGNSGDDSVSGVDGNDFIRGGAGNDSISGGDGTDNILGDGGDDTVFGDEGNDFILGGAGNDLLTDDSDAAGTTSTNDTIFGQGGDDTIFGTVGSDSLIGGAGNDLIDARRLSVSINSVQLLEGDMGTSLMSFTVLLSSPSDSVITVAFQTVDDTATAGSDYTPRMGEILTFMPGETSQTIDIAITGDTMVESDEFFFVDLFNPTGATLGTSRGIGEITNDDIAGGLAITPTTDAAVLTNAVVGMSGGITVTGMSASANTGALGEASAGTYTAGSGAAYGLTGDGIMLSTGDVATYGDGPNTDPSGFMSATQYGVAATAAQETLLDPITGGMFDHNDVTQLDIDFDLQPGFDTLFFEIVFGSEEFPDFVGGIFIDGFGIYLNGTNIATFGGSPVNINHPDFMPIAGTELNGVIAPGGNPRLTFSAPLSDGQTGNTITFIIGDTSDDTLDSTVYIASLGGTVPGTIPTPPPPPPPLVGAQEDTIDGSGGNDTILAGNFDDLIIGGNENDSIDGGGGDDTIYGGGDNDSILGGSGADSLFGNGGQDTLDGGDGDDFLNWRPDKDFQVTVIGSNGGDEAIVMGNNGTNTLTVGEDTDGLLTFAQGTATLTIDTTVEIITTNAGAGDDSITVGDIDNSGLISIDLMGGSGDDTVDLSGAMTGNAVVMVDGGDGNDTIIGSDGGDSLAGGADDDSITSGAGNDTVEGNTGNDFVDSGDGDDSVDGGDGNDNIVGGLGNDTLNGNADNDTIDGAEGNDSISGGFGNDNLNGSFDDDSIEGGLGTDLLLGASGNDTLDGGRDDDTLFGHSGDDKLRGDHGNDSLNGDGGDDELVGDDGNDSLIGGSGNDGLSGGDGDDFLLGDLGEDTIVGGDGNDNLVGGGGNDTLIGEQGDDSLNGNGGNDLGSTGEGDDATPNAVERIDENFALSTSMMDSLDGI